MAKNGGTEECGASKKSPTLGVRHFQVRHSLTKFDLYYVGFLPGLAQYSSGATTLTLPSIHGGRGGRQATEAPVLEVYSDECLPSRKTSLCIGNQKVRFLRTVIVFSSATLSPSIP